MLNNNNITEFASENDLSPVVRWSEVSDQKILNHGFEEINHKSPPKSNNVEVLNFDWLNKYFFGFLFFHKFTYFFFFLGIAFAYANQVDHSSHPNYPKC